MRNNNGKGKEEIKMDRKKTIIVIFLTLILVFTALKVCFAQSDTQLVSCTIKGSRSLTASIDKKIVAGKAGDISPASSSFRSSLSYRTDYSREQITIKTGAGKQLQSTEKHIKVTGGALKDFSLIEKMGKGDARILWESHSKDGDITQLGYIRFSLSEKQKSGAQSTENKKAISVIYTVESA